jgi:hypothetical protein
MLTFHAEWLLSSYLRMLGYLVLKLPQYELANYYRLPINLGKVLQVLSDQALVSRCRIHF